MERIHLKNIALLLCALLSAEFLSSCSKTEQDELISIRKEIGLVLKDTDPHSRAIIPEDQLVCDLNIFVFNELGLLEQQIFVDRRRVSEMGGQLVWTLLLLENKYYDIRVCANLGYELMGISDLEELESFRYHLASPYDYKGGIPMTAAFKGSIGKDTEYITLTLERLVSKISLSIDRTGLDDKVMMKIQSAAIRQCPRSTLLYKTSKALSDRDVFASGFILSGTWTSALNVEKYPGISEEASLYMLENRQDRLNEGTCSYIELKMDYHSEEWTSTPEHYLIYRFYLGGGPDNYEIERNCHYHFVVRPEGDGLSGTGWRVDKSQLSTTAESPIHIHPSDYIEARRGESLHVWAEMDNPSARFDIGLEELEYEKERGMFDYRLDQNGKGVTLFLKNKGTAILYMSSGSNEAMAVIVIS